MDDVLKQSVITQDVALGVGNTLTVKLGSNYSTPYRWKADTKIGNATIVKQTSHEYVQPTTDALGAPWHRGVDIRGVETRDDDYHHLVCQHRGQGRQTGVHVYGERDGAVNLSGKPLRTGGTSGYALADDTGEVIGTHGFYIDITGSYESDVQRRVGQASKAIATDRAVVERARAILMYVYNFSAEDALSALRWRSRETGVSLRVFCELFVREVTAAKMTPDLVRREAGHVLLTAHERIPDRV